MLSVFVYHFPNDLFRLSRRLAGRRQRRISRQPDVDVRKIRQVFRKELRLELRHDFAAGKQKHEGAGHYFPAMIDGPRAETVISSSKTFLASLGNRQLKLRF